MSRYHETFTLFASRRAESSIDSSSFCPPRQTRESKRADPMALAGRHLLLRSQDLLLCVDLRAGELSDHVDLLPVDPARDGQE